MTSSQALLFNLFGPIAADREWLPRVMSQLLPGSGILSIEDFQLEYAPKRRSLYLGDMTRVDLFVQYSTASGSEAAVLELKYTDRFSNRRVRIADNQQYLDLAEQTKIWSDHSETFSSNQLCQLTRCHALAARVIQVRTGRTRPTKLIVISSSHDLAAARVLENYRTHLTEPWSAAHFTIEDFLDIAAREAGNAQKRKAIRDLRLRYTAHSESQAHWYDHQNQEFAE